MTKYRIVSRPCYLNSDTLEYYAQYKLIGSIWLDCDFDFRFPGASRSANLKLVEEFIEAKQKGKPLNRSQKVVKVYD